jgi:hypothetical protein
MKNYMRILAAAAALAGSAGAHASSCWVTEYQYNKNVTYQTALAVPAVAKQTVAITGTSTQSNAFNSATYIIRVVCDATASIEIGTTNPTATTTSALFYAGVPEYFTVNSGDKLAVISNS